MYKGNKSRTDLKDGKNIWNKDLKSKNNHNIYEANIEH